MLHFNRRNKAILIIKTSRRQSCVEFVLRNRPTLYFHMLFLYINYIIHLYPNIYTKLVLYFLKIRSFYLIKNINNVY